MPNTVASQWDSTIGCKLCPAWGTLIGGIWPLKKEPSHQKCLTATMNTAFVFTAMTGSRNLWCIEGERYMRCTWCGMGLLTWQWPHKNSSFLLIMYEDCQSIYHLKSREMALGNVTLLVAFEFNVSQPWLMQWCHEYLYSRWMNL